MKIDSPSRRDQKKTERKRERNLSPANTQRRQGWMKLGGYWRRVNGRRRRIWALKVEKDEFAAERRA